MSEETKLQKTSSIKETAKAVGRGIERAAPVLRDLSLFALVGSAFALAIAKSSSSPQS